MVSGAATPESSGFGVWFPGRDLAPFVRPTTPALSLAVRQRLVAAIQASVPAAVEAAQVCGAHFRGELLPLLWW